MSSNGNWIPHGFGYFETPKMKLKGYFKYGCLISGRMKLDKNLTIFVSAMKNNKVHGLSLLQFDDQEKEDYPICWFGDYEAIKGKKYWVSPMLSSYNFRF